MTSNLPSIDDRQTQDRETLCALFDGQLRGDEARFALKRLGHDVQWREAVGRWQLYGDTLRGQANGIAAGGFAERVALAIERESMTQQIVVPQRAAGGRRGWIGGALAASVAVAALFVTRPFSNDAPSTSDPATAMQIASAPAPAAAAAASSPAPAPMAPTSPGPDRSLGLSAAAVAAVEVPRRATERRSSRSQNQRAALRASRQIEIPAAVATAGVAQTAIADAAAQPIAPKPFQPQHAEPASRPWPRAVLPQYSGNGAMTASFETGNPTSPSFYPFEPQSTAPSAAETPPDREPMH